MTGKEFEQLHPKEPCIPVKDLREWLLGQWTVLEAEQATLEQASQNTVEDQMNNGLRTAMMAGSLAILRQLEEDIIQPHTNG